MEDNDGAPTFEGDAPAAAEWDMLPDRRELALVAVERTRMPMVISDPRKPDNPIVLANHAFLDLTGYSAEEVLGRNCRFLQGPDTAEADIDKIRRELAAGAQHVEVEILNYRKDGSTFWNQLAISAVHDDAGDLLYHFASQKDVTSRREVERLEKSERLLLMEVDHRALNALAMVRSIVKLSRADSIETFSQSIKGRVDALARAHRLLALSGWSSASLSELVAGETAGSRVAHSGADLRLAPRLVQPLCLVLHELVANACEHGGLSRQGGQAAVRWEAGSAGLALHWTESGVALLVEPAQLGLGLNMVKGMVEQQLGGQLALDWSGDGLRASVAVPWDL
jgi:PAS domain S-box-containing protein